VDTVDPFPKVKSSRDVTLTTHRHLDPVQEWVGAIFPLPLGTCMAVAGQLFYFTNYSVFIYLFVDQLITR
jgi:hypothetical protein